MQSLLKTWPAVLVTHLRTLPVLALYVLAGCAEDYTGRDGDGIVIDSIRPTEGYPGTVFRLYGRGFSSLADSNRVYINGTAAPVDDPASLSTLLVTVPYAATTGAVTIEAAGMKGRGPVFTVFDIPRIDLADTYTEGKTLTIIGDHFSTERGLVRVYFDDKEVNVYRTGLRDDGKPYLETPFPPDDGDNPISIVIVSEGIKSLPYSYTVKPRLDDMKYFNNIDGNTYLSTSISLYGSFFGLDAAGNKIQLTVGSGPFTGDIKIVKWSPYRIDIEAVATNSAFSTIAVVVQGVPSNTLIFYY